ncbi:hypothetical protein PHLCEN_2v4454 [Hermanssonia centrifuga]|uniref:Uncharacterized protein n=1 Tax=Hermanssonia centrifuga TaxID=98765 RepID=A0A2R6PNG9_9APHY|nr:hypothetical protein PHLCEN_2v4454 [Hermanssonia centrifuga]
MPSELRKPVKSPTPPHLAKYVLLGAGDDSGIYASRDNLPIDPVPPNCASLPLWVMCTSIGDARSLFKLERFVKLLINQEPAAILRGLQVLKDSNVTKELLFGKGTYYAVLEGLNGTRGIFRTWSDTYPILHTSNVRNFIKTSCLFDAIQYIIQQGGLLQAEIDEEGELERLAQMLMQAGINDVPPTQVPRGRPTTPPSEGPPHAPPSQPRSSRTQKASSRSDPPPSPFRGHASVAHTDAPTTSPPVEDDIFVYTCDLPGPGIPPPSSTRSSRFLQAASSSMPPELPQPSLERDPALQFARDSRHRTRTSTQPRILTHLRDAHGRTTGTVYLSVSQTNNTSVVHSLGRILDTFLDSWGYADRLVEILYISRLGVNTVDEFVTATSRYTTSAEARWYWSVMDIPVGGVCRTRTIPYVEVTGGEE